MAAPPEQPWSDYEKNHLLAEIIKAANPSPDVLYNIIRSSHIQPRWEDTPLPPGRSLNACRAAYDDLRRSLSLQPMAISMAPLTPTPLSAPVSLKRSLQHEGPYSAGAVGREIRPKPSLGGAVYPQPAPTEPPPKRKRGRPTKAEAQAKAEAVAASGGEPGPAPKPRPSAHTSGPPAAPRAMMAPGEEVKPTIPQTTRMPIAAMLTPTAREPKSASHSSSSSGKRRRARSTRSEQGESAVTRQLGGRSEYESPYARVAATEDSPAKTAALRHREDPAHLMRAAPSNQPTEGSDRSELEREK